MAIDREVLANVAQDLVHVFFFFDHLLGGFGDLGRVARLDRILVGKNATCEHGETVQLDALFADEPFATVAEVLHHRPHVLDRLFGFGRELEFVFLPLLELFLFPLFDEEVGRKTFRIDFFFDDVEL